MKYIKDPLNSADTSYVLKVLCFDRLGMSSKKTVYYFRTYFTNIPTKYGNVLY